MIYLLLILIIGINFAPFILLKLDIWHAQGIFAQAVILLIFSWTFFEKQKFREPINRPIAVLTLWLGIHTIVWCCMSQINGRYDITHFFPYFNFLCILILYKSIVQYLNIRDIKWVLTAFKYSIIVTTFLCVLQYFNLAEFFTLLNPKDPWQNNLVVGFIGNGTHLSGFLAMMAPLFFTKKREDILTLVLIGIILLFLTGTTKDDPALSGIVIFICLILYFLLKTKPSAAIVLLCGLIGAGILVYLLKPEILDFSASKSSIETNFLTDNGRLGLWKFYWNLSRQNFIKGAGIGAVNLIYQKTPFPTARHVHLEYLHFLFETGLIGLTAICYVIIEFIKIKTKDKEALVLKCIFLGFLLSGIFNYPMHIWLSSTYACVSYACLIAWNERIKDARYPKTNQG